MNQEQAAKPLELPTDSDSEQSSISVEQDPSEQLDDSELDLVVGGDGSPDDPSGQEITILRSPV